MYLDDHGYPHFHAYHADGAAKVRIDSVELMATLNGANSALCPPGPSYIKQNWKKTGTGRGPVKNYER